MHPNTAFFTQTLSDSYYFFIATLPSFVYLSQHSSNSILFLLTMIELIYLASQLQCGVGGDILNIQVDIYHNQELVETMMVNDTALLPVDSVTDLTFEYSIVDNSTGCYSLALPTELLVAPGDDLPSMAGFSGQDSVQNLLQGLNNYEKLLLVELGTTNPLEPDFDMQDAIFRINNNPLGDSVFPD